MNCLRSCATALIAGLALGGACPSLAQVRVLPDPLPGGAAKDMTHRLLRSDARREFARWRKEREDLRTADDIRAWQTRLRARFVDALGGFPKRTPLNARVVGSVQKARYRVEKVILESRPGFLVTGALFLPGAAEHPPPWPGVLVPCGHSKEGKASELYQRACGLLAHNGIAAFIFDPVDQGERVQVLDENGRAAMWGTRAHTHAGIGAILLGTNTAGYEVWDAMRCVDYMVERPNIDNERLGCMGNSGGGTQTAYLVALDDRIKAASPSCYITNLYERILDLGPQDAEQNIFGQLRWHMDHADYLTMRAPVPVLVCAATRDFFHIEGTWDSFRTAKRLFSRLGHAERIDIIEHDARHGYARPLREAAVRWMCRWLAGRDIAVTEPADLEVLSLAEIQCTRDGQVMQLPGARSIYDLHRQRLADLEARRPALNAAVVRSVAGIRKLEDIPGLDVVSRRRLGGRRSLELIHLSDGNGLHLPVAIAHPTTNPAEGVSLVAHHGGLKAVFAAGGIAESLLARRRTVCAVDVRGVGETRQAGQRYHRGQGEDGIDVYMAYLLGRSYVGMRAEDMLATARWLASETGIDHVALRASGALTVAARHAAYVEPELLSSVTLSDSKPTWTDVIRSGRAIDQLQNAVHGGLRAYRLEDLDR